MTDHRPFFEITHGATRTVFLIGSLAFKIPCIRWSWREFLKGMLANDNEKTFNSLQSDLLIPILWAAPFGFLNVMPRATVLLDWHPGLDEIYDADHPYELDFVEKKPDSWGWYRDKLVAVDYG